MFGCGALRNYLGLNVIVLPIKYVFLVLVCFSARSGQIMTPMIKADKPNLYFNKIKEAFLLTRLMAPCMRPSVCPQCVEKKTFAKNEILVID